MLCDCDTKPVAFVLIVALPTIEADLGATPSQLQWMIAAYPLAFAVEEAHRRGLELHAWLNPYRARRLSETTPAAKTHVTIANPELVRLYGSFLWMDPGEPQIRRRVVYDVRDIFRRFDIDGVHIDDYFYPYQERDSSGTLLESPDSVSWARYVGSAGELSRDDWRRGNVDAFVRGDEISVLELNPRFEDLFGYSVAVSANTAIVGAPGADGFGLFRTVVPFLGSASVPTILT